MKNISIHTVKDGRKEPHLGDESSDFRTEELQVRTQEILLEDYLLDQLKEESVNISESEELKIKKSFKEIKEILSKELSVNSTVSLLKKIFDKL